jgi:hypothetical protein
MSKPECTRPAWWDPAMTHMHGPPLPLTRLSPRLVGQVKASLQPRGAMTRIVAVPKIVKRLPRDVVAHHEAGHFVAAYVHATHESIDSVTIDLAGTTAGVNSGEYPLCERPSVREIHNLIVGLFAGHAAEVRFDPSRDTDGTARPSSSGDDEKADTHLRWVCKSKKERAQLEDRLRRQARALVDEHWAAVVALAHELVLRTSLDVYEATWIVAIATGKEAKRDLAEYRLRRAIAAKPAAS